MTITAGGFTRQAVRRKLFELQIPYKEDRGLLDSMFLLDERQQAVQNGIVALEKWLERVTCL